MEPKVSVIIPVYNTDQYIGRCLESVIKQSLHDIEIICINDASTDESLAILQKYAEKDVRIRILAHEKNRGVGLSRDLGVAESTGEYLAFLDGDDSFDLDFCEKLYSTAKENDADMAKGLMHLYDFNGNPVIHGVDINNKIKNGNKFYFTWMWTTAIYRSKLVKNKIFFNNYSLGEDTLFLIKFLVNTDNIVTRNDTFYNYFKRENSCDSLVISDDKLISIINIYEEIFIILNFYNVYEIDIDAYTSFVLSILSRIIIHTSRNINHLYRKLGYEKSFDIFARSKWKKILVEKMNSNMPEYVDFFINNDAEGLSKYMAITSPQKRMFAKLRSRLKK